MAKLLYDEGFDDKVKTTQIMAYFDLRSGELARAVKAELLGLLKKKK